MAPSILAGMVLHSNIGEGDVTVFCVLRFGGMKLRTHATSTRHPKTRLNSEIMMVRLHRTVVRNDPLGLRQTLEREPHTPC
ncbi:hypothetical protein TWF569_011150 [Orbilia oligospora]|nr:hypothetical protein TWF569_011150 [Orbilia oligospora]